MKSFLVLLIITIISSVKSETITISTADAKRISAPGWNNTDGATCSGEPFATVTVPAGSSSMILFYNFSITIPPQSTINSITYSSPSLSPGMASFWYYSHPSKPLFDGAVTASATINSTEALFLLTGSVVSQPNFSLGFQFYAGASSPRTFSLSCANFTISYTPSYGTTGIGSLATSGSQATTGAPDGAVVHTSCTSDGVVVTQTVQSFTQTTWNGLNSITCDDSSAASASVAPHRMPHFLVFTKWGIDVPVSPNITNRMAKISIRLKSNDTIRNKAQVSFGSSPLRSGWHYSENSPIYATVEQGEWVALTNQAMNDNFPVQLAFYPQPTGSPTQTTSISCVCLSYKYTDLSLIPPDPTTGLATTESPTTRPPTTGSPTTGSLPVEEGYEHVSIVVDLNFTTTSHSDCPFCDNSNYMCSDKEGWQSELQLVDPRTKSEERITGLTTIAQFGSYCDSSNSFSLRLNNFSAVDFAGSQLHCGCNQCNQYISSEANAEFWEIVDNTNFTTLQILPDTGSVVCFVSLSLNFVITRPIDRGNMISSDSESKGSSNVTGIVVGVLVGLLALVVLVALLLFFVRRRKQDEKPENLELSSVPGSVLGGSIDWAIEYSELELKTKIGSGFFGIVYHGTWRSTEVAIKMIKSEIAGAEVLEDLKQEAELMKNLRPHPNVVTFFGLCTSPICLVTEFLKEGSLVSFLLMKRNNMSLSSMISIMFDIAAGMNHLSYEKIIHKDLAVRNILMTSDGHAKIADFGLSKLVEGNSTYELSETGPVRWMAPECFTKNQFSSKSDVYAFSIVMWEILNYAEVPYKQMTNKQVREAVIAGKRLPRPNQCTNNLFSLMERCWDAQPDSRPAFQDAASELEKMLQDPGLDVIVKSEENSRVSNRNDYQNEDSLYEIQRSEADSRSTSRPNDYSNL